ncbi:hypothetical protein P175DRAFT_0510405 [Aspergillus ochraceoroseus IBT 24754]|uniref:GATA-type domain-containing protein n=2 Tax=Aspergillus ochraceoroseus TaxID=138278 RepID=A0A2T5LS55_9EURO|nr:uncharacterized protein P175DRAFT_0510405 [Aspergillus ochraceoroseus IBT 24754]KKK16453.1 hypothetical protein AOCH_007435 [Aspergillus ochraceoroseus]PTU19112.1 hypothetical protein P175DRAFT_0510405 [Aspergillus ochraceoroseus IBT 24754]
MANRGMEDFDEVFYEGQFSVAQSDRHLETQHDQMMPYTSAPMQVGSFAYPSHRNDILEGSVSTAIVPSVSNGGGRMSNPLLAFDPTGGSSMSMGLDPGSTFAYDTPAYPPSTMAVDHSLDHRQATHFTSTQSQATRLDPGPAYSAAQPQESSSSMFWGPAHDTEDVRPSMQGMSSRQSGFSHPSDPGRDQALPRSGQDVQSTSQSTSQSSSGSVLPHRFIQPKRTGPAKASSSTTVTAESSGEGSPYANVYSSSGFDMMGILAEVVSRPDPKINIGAVDLSCAFVLCDITLEDQPIVYVSQAFERLTGYPQKEIVGRNCRFLQSPDGAVEQGVPRKFVDTKTAFRLRTTIDERTEIQASIINYRKGGQPFMNLITMIPVRWDSNDYRFFVGFQVDLVEKPDAVKRRNPDGSYLINYQRSQLPSYVVPSPDMYRDDHDPATQFRPDQVAALLDGLGGGDPAVRNHLDHILVENTDDVIQVLSFEGDFLYLSPSCRKVLEYKSIDLVGKTLSTILHPSDIGPVIRDLRACTTSDPVSVIYRIRRKHSGYAWFESHGSWHISERGRQFMVLVGRVFPVYCLDQLAKMERGGLAENDIWAKLSLSGIILFMSSKSRAVLGRASDDLVGKSIQDIVGTDSRQEIQHALGTSHSSGQQKTLSHKVRHRKGHMLPAQTTFYPGDTKEGVKPSFVVAQFRFPKAPHGTSSTEESSSSDSVPTEATFAGDSSRATKPIELIMGPTKIPKETLASIDATLFTELIPTRGSSWQFELRELEKQNRSLSDEVQRLLARRKKRKRKQSAVLIEKTCARCQTKTTPEWRRGPSGNRDLCNSCGLRFAKQMRSAAQASDNAVAY